MLEETLDRTRLWNTYDILGHVGLRITAKGIGPEWLDTEIRNLSSCASVDYEVLTHPSGTFRVPVLRLRGKKPRMKVLLQVVHAFEWAATESILRFAEDWEAGRLNERVVEQYDITAVPLLSIDVFPSKYGSSNYKSDRRLETVVDEIDSSDMVVEIHETPLKNFLFLGRHIPDLEIAYSDGRNIPDITSYLDGLNVVTERRYMSYSARLAARRGIPAYVVELFSDWGSVCECLLLSLSGMAAYPMTELTTFLNRTYRKQKIRQSRLQSSENGSRTINAILTAYVT